jgi:hypothetical protein
MDYSQSNAAVTAGQLDFSTSKASYETESPGIPMRGLIRHVDETKRSRDFPVMELTVKTIGITASSRYFQSLRFSVGTSPRNAV